jgi:DNA-binding NarL/FixJ family response regulator
LRILVCDDHSLVREGLRHALRGLDPQVEVLEATDADAALRTATAHEDLDLVLLDLRLPGMDGLAALARLRELAPTVPVVMLSASEEIHDVRAALEAGASGFVPKSSASPVLLGALRLVLAGGVYLPPLLLEPEGAAPVEEGRPPPRRMDRPRGRRLTARQRQVLELVARGLTNREIAHALSIAEATVKTHLAMLFETLDVTNRTEAASVLHQLIAEDGDEEADS